jgi:hypothetical protein
MNLLDRYISEIGEHLPHKSRSDIETEIRSTLEDMLEDCSAASGSPVDDEMIIDLLKDYGSPEKIAATYQPDKYLIGPKLYPSFIFVIKIVGAVLTGVALLGFSVRFGMREMSLYAFGNQLAQSVLEYIVGLITAFGNIVLVFAILELVVPTSKYNVDLRSEKWDPTQLTKKAGPDEVNSRGAIGAIVFTMLALLVINIYPQMLGIWFIMDGQWVSTPLFSQAFFHMLPWINIACILGIGLQVVVLRQRKWTRITRWFEIGLKILGIAILILLLKGPSILDISAETLINLSIAASSAATLVKILNVMAIIALINAILVAVFEIGRGVYRLLFKNGPRILVIKQDGVDRSCEKRTPRSNTRSPFVKVIDWLPDLLTTG